MTSEEYKNYHECDSDFHDLSEVEDDYITSKQGIELFREFNWEEFAMLVHNTRKYWEPYKPKCGDCFAFYRDNSGMGHCKVHDSLQFYFNACDDFLHKKYIIAAQIRAKHSPEKIDKFKEKHNE